MLSLHPQTPLTPTASAHYIPRDTPSDVSAISLSAWYASKISEFLRATPHIPTSLYEFVTSYLNIVNPYPPLPNELIHHVFSIAAQDDAETCRQLCLVSSWTRLMVLPFHMPIVSVCSINHWLLSLQACTRPHDEWILPTIFTKSLWFSCRLQKDEEIKFDLVDTYDHSIDFRSLLALCPNISALNAPGEVLLQMKQQSALEVLHSKVTVLSIPYRFSSHAMLPELHPFLANVEDLSVSIDEEPLDLSPFRGLMRLSLNTFSDRGEHLMEILGKLGSMRQLRTIEIGLSPMTWQRRVHGDKNMSLEDMVNQVRRDDPRLALPTVAETLGWDCWRGKTRLHEPVQ